MSEPLVIVGCGGHGREIYGVIHAINESQRGRWSVLGFVDDAPSAVNLGRVKSLGTSFLGAVGQLAEMDASVRYVVGIGDPRIRARVAANLQLSRSAANPLVHPSATVGLGSELGAGTVLFAGARITSNVTVGEHVHLNQNSTVGHDSSIADFASVNPLAAVSGDCRLEEQVLIGTTAAVLQGLRVGARSIVGAGACVVRDVPQSSVVKGIPAR